jgi:hypothetical protein
MAVSAEQPSGPAIRLSRPGDARTAFEVVGLDPDTIGSLLRNAARQADVLAVRAVTAAAEKVDPLPPLLGAYSFEPEKKLLRFQPRFPLEPGVRYRADFRAPGSSKTTLSAEFGLPKAANPVASTVVARVAPASAVVPENLLKFYIEFSAPMSRGEAYDHIRLLDASGKPVDAPFLELGEELWDPRGRRFTLLFDPGRIKRGLLPREQLGPALSAGKSYTLLIDRRWHDAAGNVLASEYRKQFRVGPPDSAPPDPKSWALDTPEAGSRAPLRVSFKEPLDRALLGRLLAVTDREGNPVEGAQEIANDETWWSFVPVGPWRAGPHFLLIDRDLEDLAGNSVGRPFEVDVFRPIERRETADVVRLPFSIGIPSRTGRR